LLLAGFEGFPLEGPLSDGILLPSGLPCTGRYCVGTSLILGFSFLIGLALVGAAGAEFLIPPPPIGLLGSLLIPGTALTGALGFTPLAGLACTGLYLSGTSFGIASVLPLVGLAFGLTPPTFGRSVVGFAGSFRSVTCAGLIPSARFLVPS